MPTIVSRLLKSCAIPPAKVPSASIFATGSAESELLALDFCPVPGDPSQRLPQLAFDRGHEALEFPFMK